jgi:branched-chain amino acid transport system ATP-binding protein
VTEERSAVELSVVGLKKSFGGPLVLQDISFKIPAGLSYGLIGPNGAGKTTVVNIIAGLLAADAGQVWLGDRQVEHLAGYKRAVLGIGRTFQTMRLFSDMTALENVMVGAHPFGRVGVFHAVARKRTTKREEEWYRSEAESFLRMVGTDPRNDDLPVLGLTVSEQRAVELARALIGKPRILILDEPTSGLDPDRVTTWIDLLREMKRKLGITVLLIEHRMDVIARMSDVVVAIHGGRVIATGAPDEVLSNREVRRVYLGGLA